MTGCNENARPKTFGDGLDAKSRRQRHRLPLMQILGRQRGTEHLTDANLKWTHDLALILLVDCQAEMRRRGLPNRVDLLPILADMQNESHLGA
jgi:hypothetical protein